MFLVLLWQSWRRNNLKGKFESTSFLRWQFTAANFNFKHEIDQNNVIVHGGGNNQICSEIIYLFPNILLLSFATLQPRHCMSGEGNKNKKRIELKWNEMEWPLLRVIFYYCFLFYSFGRPTQMFAHFFRLFK